MKLPGFAAGAAVLAAMAIAPAAANTVTLGGAAEIECNDASDATIACLGIVGGSLEVTNPGNQVTGGTAGSLDDTAPFTADLYDIGNSSEANEATALNTLAGTSFSGSDGMKTETGGQETFGFTTLAQWVVIKLGAGTAFIQNTSGGALDIDFSAFAGTGGGISHITEFGVIPIPGALWLMVAGLAGLGFASRRKKSA